MSTQTASTTPTGMRSASTSSQGMTGLPATASLTPTNKAASFPAPVTGTGSNQKANAKGAPFLLLLAALGIGGGAVSVNKLWGVKENYVPSKPGGEAAVPTTVINPATVGALGFAAWLAGQVPVLTPDEKEVLAKVENGVGSAANQVGAISDLNAIAEIGTEEFLQLTKSSPFLS
ncbi:MAG: hypothetical protein ABSC61_01605 [Anaerolineales bacterium]